MLTPTDRSAFNVAEALEILSEDWAVLRYRGDYPPASDTDCASLSYSTA